MSAEVETMFYYGETPWHKLGTEVQHALTAEEAIVAAGLDWEVEKAPIYQHFNGGLVKIPNRIAVRRKTDGAVLSTLGPGYMPVQNRDAFGFLDNLVASEDAKYHTAGSLLGGQKIWLLAKLDKSGPLNIKGDQVDKYLLLMNGHDGKLALKVFFTPVRVVCANTLAAAESGASQATTFYSRHTGDIAGRISAAREILGISLKFYETFGTIANALARVQLPAPEMPKLLAAAFGTTGAIDAQTLLPAEDWSKRRQAQMDCVTALYEGQGKGLDNPAIKGTMWAAYNAVVEYVDYGREYGGKAPDDLRLKNTWGSRGVAIKDRAWNYLVAAAK